MQIANGNGARHPLTLHRRFAEAGPWPFVHAIVRSGPYTLDEMLDWSPLARPDMIFCLVWHVVRLGEDDLRRASELRVRLEALANPTMW